MRADLPAVRLDVTQRYRWIYKPLVFVACLVPIALLLSRGFGMFGQSLGPDPIKFTLHWIGKTALNLIMITLLVTPVRHLAGWPHIVRIRRMLGLFAFFYALLHFTIYIVLDQELDFAGLLKDIAKRPYITVGFAALVILIPLAITSTNKMMRRLGRRWQTLHRWVYAAAILSVVHYYWQVKRDVREPLIYAAILAVLLGYRLVRRMRKAKPASAPATSTSGSATAPERT
ncbi:MAG TPA: protein-methionine-sulfoxide reductase heme-binding subunit MsrQ [Steroidobacteraceae bacterium]|nr:protein-methionine-sulfoxide reductase heme-binding subunit MsrQ [Steroidobacteraceae bacterium]